MEILTALQSDLSPKNEHGRLSAELRPGMYAFFLRRPPEDDFLPGDDEMVPSPPIEPNEDSEPDYSI